LPTSTATDAYSAADRYRKAVELYRQARGQMIASVEADRADLNLAGVARRAGLQEKSLYRMLKREGDRRNGNT
jgi:DNA-binding phage protein